MKTHFKIISPFIILCILFVSNDLFAQQKQKRPKREKKGDRTEQKIPVKNIIEELERQLGPDWEDTLLGHVGNEYPGEIEGLKKEKAKNPSKYYRKLSKLWKDINRELSLKDEDPERYQKVRQQHELDRQCKKLAEKYRKSADETQKAAIKDELKIKLGELFLLRAEEKAAKIEKLEQELKKLKQTLSRRKEIKEQIINKRLSQLLGEDKEIDW